MLRYTQLLIFEVSRGCNLAAQHAGKCPIGDPHRWDSLDTSRTLDDDTICASVRQAYRQLDFHGYVAWHLYNEPCLDWPRLRRLMERIKRETPEARFYLFTNGELLPHDRRQLEIVDALWVSNYCGADWSDVTAWHRHVAIHDGPPLDDRLEAGPADGCYRCLRPYTEVIVDHFGNFHVCCFDWRGRVKLPNLFDAGFEAGVRAVEAVARRIGRSCVTEDAPEFCRKCRWKNDACPVDGDIRRELLDWIDGPHRAVGESDSTERLMIAREFCGKTEGRFLEIGAYDGLTESLTMGLVRRGWTGVQVEPSPAVFVRLLHRHGGNPKLEHVNAAVTPDGGMARFWRETKGAQCSTLRREFAEHFARNRNHQYDSYHVATVSVRDLLARFGGVRNWHFVLIDAEGVNVELLRAMPLREMVDTELLCIEHPMNPDAVRSVLPDCYEPFAVTRYNVLARRRPCCK